MRIFVICPVRNVSEETNTLIRQYITDLEKDGHDVYWPYRDTDQSDTNGINICTANREAIYSSDEIHIWFDADSQGSLFDVGMTFAFLRNNKKKLVLINKKDVSPTPHKSFSNVLLELVK